MTTRLWAVMAMCGVSASVLAAPVSISQAGRLLGANDAPVTSSALPMTFRVVDQVTPSVGEAVVWTTTCNVNVVDGYYGVVLGSATCGAGLGTEHVATTAGRWLEVAVGSVTLLPRLPLGTVPTAAWAATSADAQQLRTQLATAGTVNTAANPVDWTALKNVPSEIVNRDAATLGGVPAAQYARQTDLSQVNAVALGGVAPTAFVQRSEAEYMPRTDVLAQIERRLCEIRGGTYTGSTCTGAQSGGVAGTSGKIAKFTSSTQVGDSVLVESAGNVGVGVASPQATLHVGGPVIVGASTTCGASTAGAVAYSASTKSMQFCDGSAWQTLSTVATVRRSCLEWKLLSGAATDGVYRIDPDGSGSIAAFDAYCDQTTDDGGWTLVAALGPGGTGGNVPAGETATKPMGRTVPGNDGAYKFSDDVINAIKDGSRSAPGIRYETTAGKKFGRGSCVWKSNTVLTMADTACRDVVLTYSASPSWITGTTSDAIGGCPGSGLGVVGPGSTCTAGTGNMAFLLLNCGSRTDIHFHRHWCGDGPTGYLWVR